MKVSVDSLVKCAMSVQGVSSGDFAAMHTDAFKDGWAAELNVNRGSIEITSVTDRSRRRGLFAAAGVNVAFAVKNLGQDPAVAAAVSSGISSALGGGGGGGGAVQQSLAASFKAAGLAAPEVAVTAEPQARAPFALRRQMAAGVRPLVAPPSEPRPLPTRRRPPPSSLPSPRRASSRRRRRARASSAP